MWNPGKLLLYNRVELKTSDHRQVLIFITAKSHNLVLKTYCSTDSKFMFSSEGLPTLD